MILRVLTPPENRAGDFVGSKKMCDAAADRGRRRSGRKMRIFGSKTNFGSKNIQGHFRSHTDCYFADIKSKVTHTDCFSVDHKFKVTHTDCSKVCYLNFE